MSTRRSTRERKKPKAVYEVEDRRKSVEQEEEEEEKREDQERTDDQPMEEDDDDAQEDDTEEEEDDEAFEVNEKPTPKKRVRASPQPKRPPAQRKTAATPRPRKLKPVPEEARPRKQKSRQQQDTDGDGDMESRAEQEGDEEEDDDDVFFEAVTRGKASMTDLVVEWRERFDEDPELATREVLNFVLQSCGGAGQCVPSTERLERLDMSDLVDYVVDDLQKSNDGYPIASRAKAHKKFRQNYIDFWDAFIKECYESELMFSTQIVEQFVDWLTSLSSAEVRAIRHTTTIAAYAVGNALVDCTEKLTHHLSVVQRQLNAESSSAAASRKTAKSPPKSASSKKLEQLRENKKMYEERKKMLLDLVQLLFNGVVVHRYRDVMPEVRVESVRVLGNWISVVPDHYLKDNYLKYLGWVLNDKDALVRLGVVKVLLRLYENESFGEKMELFTSRFLPRFLELCNDVDDGVVEACIKLLIAIDKRSLISSDVELHSVERLVFDESNEVIRKAAAEFVCLQYDAFGVAESNRSAKLTKEQLNTQAIALVEFAEEYITNHRVPAEAVATMVDAFWGLDDCQVLQEWKLLTSLLLADKNAPDLTSEQQTLLIRLLVASIEKIATNESEKSSSTTKKKLAKEKDELCVTFCKEIPNMLVRFQADVEKLSLIVELIPLLTLSGDVSGLQPTHVKSLLEKLRHAYAAHSEIGLLKSLGLSIHHLRKSENEVIKRESDVIIHELLQEVLDKLEEALEEDEKLSSEPGESNDKSRMRKRNSKKKDKTDSEYAVRTALSRLQCLITHLSIRDFLPQAHGRGVSASPGKRKRARESSSGALPSHSRMERLAAALVEFVRRRTKKVTELDPAFLDADSIKCALGILFADVLWLTQPVFSKLTQKEQSDGASGSGPSDANIAEIEAICSSRSLLEDAVTAVLEMHMNKIEKPRAEEDEENGEPHIEMEEIELTDPRVAIFVKEAQRAAFLIFCDTRCLFVERFKDCDAPFDMLDWPLSKVLVLLTQMYFENEMESNPEDQPEDEENTEETTERDLECAQDHETSKAASDRGKAEILVALGRVSQSNPSNKRQAAAVLRYLIDGGDDSQEVVRAFSRHIKTEAPVRYLEVQMTALRQLYMTILGLREDLEGVEDDDATREELEETIAISEGQMKELAKKLSQSLGVGKVAASLRAPFFRFLCEGVRYAMERPSQFSFLDALRVYLSHLDKSSTKQLYAYFTELLEGLAENAPREEIRPEWRTVFEFQSMISDPNGVVKSTAMVKALKRKRKLSITSSRGHEVNDDIRSQLDVDEADAEMEDVAGSTPLRKDHQPTSIETPQQGSNTRLDGGVVDDDRAATDGARSPNHARTSSAKRKLDIADDENPTPKKARAAHNQSRRGSSGRITQLSDDEDDRGVHDKPGNEELEIGDKSRTEANEGENEEEIASRRSRRLGRGRN